MVSSSAVPRTDSIACRAKNNPANSAAPSSNTGNWLTSCE